MKMVGRAGAQISRVAASSMADGDSISGKRTGNYHGLGAVAATRLDDGESQTLALFMVVERVSARSLTGNWGSARSHWSV